MKKTLLIAVFLGAAASAVSITHHKPVVSSKDECCSEPVCLPGDPSPPCPSSTSKR